MAIMPFMVDRQAYFDIYSQAISELSDLVNEREEIDVRREQIDQRLLEVRKGVIALAPLCGMSPWADHPEWFPEIENTDIGFTSAVRRVLQSDLRRFFSPVQVRDGLKDVGYQ